jgi:hypothetical protein
MSLSMDYNKKREFSDNLYFYTFAILNLYVYNNSIMLFNFIEKNKKKLKYKK